MRRFCSSLSRSFLTIALGVTLSLVTACSKSGEPVSGAPALTSDLLARVPASAIGYFTFDTASDAFKKYKVSPWGSQRESFMSALDQLIAMGDETKAIGERAKTIFQSLEKAGLLTWGTQADALKEGVFFIDSAAPDTLQGGVFATATSGVDLKQKLTALEGDLKTQGFQLTPEELNGGKGFSFRIDAKISPEASAAPSFQVFHVIATSDRLAVVSSPALVQRLLAPGADKGAQEIQASASYKELASRVSPAQNEVSFAYFDFAKLIAAVPSISAAFQKKMENEGNAVDLASLPLQRVAWSRKMDDSFSDIVAASLSPKSDDQKKLFAALSGSGAQPVLQRAPADLMMLIGLDGKALLEAKNSALSGLPPDQREALASSLNIIDSIKSLAIGVRGSSSGSPFPDLFIFAESDKAPELTNSLKTQLSAVVGSTGMPASKWQTKSLGGVNVDYAISPFGVGAYVTTTGTSVILASSETAATDAIAAAQNKSNSLFSTLSDSSRKSVNTKTPVFVAFSDFEKLADLVHSAQGTLAMFTGGKGSFDASKVDALRKMGAMTLALNYEPGVLELRSNYSIPTKK